MDKRKIIKIYHPENKRKDLILYVVECIQCGKHFELTRGWYNKGRGTFCSTTCDHKYRIGKKRSLETRINISRGHIGQKPMIKFQETEIEKSIEKELKNRKIDYQKQKYLCKFAKVDFLLPQNKIVIECDGDYWHNLPNKKNRDILVNEVLRNNGYTVYRFWEHEIKKSPQECLDKIMI